MFENKHRNIGIRLQEDKIKILLIIEKSQALLMEEFYVSAVLWLRAIETQISNFWLMSSVPGHRGRSWDRFGLPVPFFVNAQHVLHNVSLDLLSSRAMAD